MDAIFIAAGSGPESLALLAQTTRMYVHSRRLTWQILTGAGGRAIFEGQAIGLNIGGNFSSKLFSAFKRDYTLTEPIDFLRAKICSWCRKGTRLAICVFNSDFITAHFSLCYGIDLKLSPGDALILHGFDQTKAWQKEYEIFYKGGEKIDH